MPPPTIGSAAASSTRKGQPSRRTALSTACLLALGLATQTIQAQAQAQSATAGAQDVQRVEITTQARKRTEAAKDVPITMEVFGGKFLEDANITTATQLQYNVPGLTIQPLESGGLVSLRGVGSGSTGLGYDPSSAVHIDGIYVGTSSQALNRLFDLGTLEVLKGPQGTLYGRNATGGVINIVTQKPSAKFGGTAEVGFGNQRRRQAELALNVPLAESTSLRLAATGAADDGAITNLRKGTQVGDDDHAAVRARLFTRLGGISADLLLQHVQDRSTRAFSQVPDPRLPLPVAINSQDTSTTALGYRKTYLLEDPKAKKSDTVLGLTLQGEINDSVSWKSITGVLDFKGDSAFDVSSFGQSWYIRNLAETTKQVSQEFQLLINSGQTDWVLGAYYYRQKGTELRQANIDENLDGNVIFNSQDSSSTANATAYALFADANHRLSKTVRLNVGVRANRESKDASVLDRGLGAYFPANPLVKQKVSFSDLSGRVGLDWTLARDTLVFGSVSKGFKAGGIQPFLNPGSGALETYKPETLVAYETGIKHALPGRAGIINASLFYYDYQDIQVRLTDLSSDNIRNASSAKIYGLDLQADFKIAGPLGIDFTGEWLKANYNTFLTEDRQGNPLNFTGNVLPRAPKQSYAVGLNLDRMALGAWQLSGRLEYTYRGKIFFEASNTTKAGEDLSVAEGLGLANINMTLTQAGAPWSVKLSARNLADKKYLDQSIFGLSFPGAGRSYLAAFNYRF
jgi:iron complex outermembrane receptor protein